MTTANAHLMSRSANEVPAAKSTGTARASHTRSGTIGDAISFALVGVAIVGFVVETLDKPTDNLGGVLQVAAGAFIGSAASVVYGWLETSTERAARVRLTAWSVVRFFVAFELMRYGTAKLVGMQFYPRYYALDTRPADMTPMALAWTFFGRTYGYQAMSGVIEVAAALLLCYRRTATLGACVLLPVMANVVLVDFFYDVPVTLFSSIYLVMGLYLLAPDAGRFWTFFLGDGPTPSRAYLSSPRGHPGNRIANAFVVALVIVLPIADIVHKAVQRGVFHTDRLEGAWIVERRAGFDAELPGVNGSWDRIYFEKGDYGFLRVGTRRLPFQIQVDEKSGTMRLFQIGDQAAGSGSGAAELFATFRVEGKQLHVEGSHQGTPFSIDLLRDLPR